MRMEQIRPARTKNRIIGQKEDKGRRLRLARIM